MQYHIITYGCQMNQSDSERIACILESKGYKSAPTLEGADLVVVNFCSVRQKPVEKAMQKILDVKSKSLKNQKIIATGCILEKDKKWLKEQGVEIKKFKGIEKIKPVSGFVPIMRGCNNFCSYCVVPYTRDRESSRSPQVILQEVKSLLKKGMKEITLLGQNVNSYQYRKLDFVGLLKLLTALPSEFKIKFITNHPKDFSDALIQEMASNPKIIKYVHLPFQAGDNKILKKMNRQYTRADYLKLIKKIRQVMPDVEITTDIIVGFPGETKKQFQKTVEVMKKVKFKQAYIAKYSPRPGTAAFELKDNVPLAEKKCREQILRKILRGRATASFKPKLVVVLGPTASGKTDLAIKLAKKFNGEIVSADSRQIYRAMDIGTAKPSKKELKAVPHHLLDIASPKRKISVAQYQKKAFSAIDRILKKGKAPFLVGGSAFYLYSVVEGFKFPKMKRDLKLRHSLEKKSARELFKMLCSLAPQRAKTIEKQNKRRLIRAIEIAKALGRVPQLKKQPRYDCLLLGLKPVSNEILRKKINQRVDQMLKQGLEQEVKRLVKKHGLTPVLRDTIGYVEWLNLTTVTNCSDRYSLLRLGKQQKQAVVEQIKSRTYQFSRRQMTWFKRDKKIRWVKTQHEAEKLIKKFLT